MKHIDNFGYQVIRNEHWYKLNRGLKKLNQLDLLDILFPGILVFERENKANIYDLFDELPDVDW